MEGPAIEACAQGASVAEFVVRKRQPVESVLLDSFDGLVIPGAVLPEVKSRNRKVQVEPADQGLLF